MGNEEKDFMEKVKDEFKKVRKAIDDLTARVISLEEKFEGLEKPQEKKKNEDWF